MQFYVKQKFYQCVKQIKREWWRA